MTWAKPLADVSITDKNGVVTWNPYFESFMIGPDAITLTGTLFAGGRSAISATNILSLGSRSDHPGRNQGISLESGPLIIEAMLEAISGTSVNQPVTKLMLRADQESVSRDLKQNRLNVDEFSMAYPLNGMCSTLSAVWLKRENGRSMNRGQGLASPARGIHRLA